MYELVFGLVSNSSAAGLGDSGEKYVWAWYAFLCIVCAAFNVGYLVYTYVKTPSKDSYGTWMKALAVPWVLECAWRSVFPSLYLQRFAFWDVWMNSIVVDRCWACVGELAWTYQVALALRHVDKQVTGGKWWIQASGWLAFVVYILAECTSYYNVATTNEFWAAIEVLLDGAAFFVMAPAAIYLWCKIPGSSIASAKGFCLILSLVSTIYPCYNVFVDAPMYMARYKADQAAGKHYFSFLEGLE